MESLHVDATIIYDLSARAIFTFPTVYVCRPRWPGRFQALAMHAKVSRWRQSWILNFCVKILLLPNYRVKYYDYIVKWCSGIVSVCWCSPQQTVHYFSSYHTVHVYSLHPCSSIQMPATNMSWWPFPRQSPDISFLQQSGSCNSNVYMAFYWLIVHPLSM